MILWNDKEYSNKLNSAVFPGTQGGPLMHIIAAKAQCFYEALQPDFHLYTERVIANANMMAKTFIAADVEIVSGGTQSHMFTINLNKEKYSGREFADLLEEKGITVNKNGVPNDTRGFIETSGVRIGVAAETTRGNDEEWFKTLAQIMIQYLRS
jgi:glycine hydroxymethyltransferase